VGLDPKEHHTSSLTAEFQCSAESVQEEGCWWRWLVWWGRLLAGRSRKRLHVGVRRWRGAGVMFPRQEFGEPSLCRAAVQAPVMAAHSSPCLSFGNRQ